MSTFYAEYPVEGGGSGVSSLNTLTGALTILAGTGISVTPSGSSITIATTAGSSTWLSTDWSSNNSQSFSAFSHLAPSISGNPALNTRYYVGVADVPLANTTTSGAELGVTAGAVLEPTSIHPAGNLILAGGTNDGTGNAGSVLIQAGQANNGGTDGNIILEPAANTSVIQFATQIPSVVGQVWTALDTSGSGAWQNAAGGTSPTSQVLTSSGTYTTPAGATFLKVTIVGDGAGGGGAPNPGTGNSCGGGGGGAGAVCIAWITSPAASYPYVIGTGGTGGTGAATGLAGTGSWFASSSTYVAGGGAAGPSGGVAPFVTPSTGNALGGVASGGMVNLNGGDGGCGFCFSPNNGLGGYGGSNAFAGQVAGPSSITNGAHGYPFGGGGSGASNVGAAGMDTTGGNGAAGIIIVEEYY